VRIGIDTVDQFGGSFNSYEVGAMTPTSLVDMVKSLHQDLGVDVVEINASVHSVRPDMVTEETLKEIGRYQAKSDVGLTVHLPFRGIDLDNLVEPMRDAAACYQRDLVRAFDANMKVDHYVTHIQSNLLRAIRESKGHTDEAKVRMLARMEDQARRSLETILETCEPKRLAVENLEMGYELPFRLAEEFDTGLCCDVGHLVIEQVDVPGTIAAYLDRIIHFHYHDVIEVEDEGEKKLKDHVALGMGMLDIPATLKVMVDGNFGGVLLVEVVSREYADTSLTVLRKQLQQLTA